MKSVFLLALTLAALLLYGLPTPQAAEPAKPNVLIILADDMGFSDAGCYGGEIATPNLDALAKNGLRFTQFYNTARCWPSRAAILTGYYAQQVRRDTVPGVKSGASGTRPAWARLLPEMLRPLGYRSYHSGKWHVDGKPLQNGFDHSYSLDDHDRHFAPRQHTEDDKPLPPVDAGERLLLHHRHRRPRHQVPEGARREASRTSRSSSTSPSPRRTSRCRPRPRTSPATARRTSPAGTRCATSAGSGCKELKIGGTALSAVERDLGPPYAFPEAIKKLGPDEVNRPLPWDDLTRQQREFQASKMAIHAAMVDRMDREIGRVLEQLRAMGRWTTR